MALCWIGDEFFIEVGVPSAGGGARKELKGRTQGTLEKIYQKGFWKYLKHFEGFCNAPSHFDYKQVVAHGGKEFYNRYFPFRWTGEKGGWKNIEAFLKHIFGEEEVEHAVSGEKIPRWEMGLDYIQILLKEPTRMLPVLILYSPENTTGKSTFGRLLQALFSDNVVPIGNADLQSDFNETYSDKLLAICEETLLDRKKDVERIKSLSTNPRILVNPKGQKQYQIDFFCKFVFMSNNARMVYVTRHDQRFWILRVPQFAQEIPNFMEMMEAEVPAFVHHLSHRKLRTERESRMHFHPSLLHTDTFEETVKVNEPSAASDMRERIEAMFLQEKDLERLELPLGEIRQLFFTAKTSDGWIREILRDHLQVKQLRNEGGRLVLKRGSYPIWEHDSGQGDLVRKVIPFRGRPYIFSRADFVQEENPEDYLEMQKVEEALAQKKFRENAPAPLREDDLEF